MRTKSFPLRRLAGACAATALLAGAASPAHADTLPLDLDDGAAQLNAICQVQPNVNSGFTAIAINVSLEVIDVEETGSEGSTIVGNGTPVMTPGAWYFAHLHNNAGDIFAYRDYAPVYATATQTGGSQTTTTYQYEFDCHVHKAQSGKTDSLGHVGFNAPAGQQSTGITSEAFEVTSGEGPTTTTLYNWTDPEGATTSKDLVICIYGRKGWSVQNGYDGSLGTCGTTFFNTLDFPKTTEWQTRPTPTRGPLAPR